MCTTAGANVEICPHGVVQFNVSFGASHHGILLDGSCPDPGRILGGSWADPVGGTPAHEN